MSSTRFPEKWIVPAGSVEPGESDVAAAVREIYEEVSTATYFGPFLA